MTGVILAMLVFGVATGAFFLPASFANSIDSFISMGLIVVLLLVGISVGRQKDLLEQLRRMGARILLIPLMIGLGSILGSITAGVLVLDMPWYEAGAAGAGFGWYSF
jgi:uncharacterized membrane protein YbjE (DUF340 family)